MQDMTKPISRGEIKRERERLERRVANINAQIERLEGDRAVAEQQLAAARDLRPVAKPRIDTIPAGSRVRLLFTGSFNRNPFEEEHTFLGIEGEGDSRRARFHRDEDGQYKAYDWEAYRYNGGWAYGSSAERLQLLAVLS